MRTELARPLLLTVSLVLLLGACNGDDKRETDSLADLDEGSCTPGELDCECNAGQCLGDLECVAGTCVSPSCTPGELGCECSGGQCLGELECLDGLCTDPNCTPGELACECNGGQCLGELECVDNVCIEGAGTSDSTEDTGGCGAGEMLCDGVCTDVQSDDANCGTCGNACDVVGTTGGCVEGMCAPALSECVVVDDPPKSCNEICAEFGKTCVNLGCDGMTYSSYGSLNFCEQLMGAPNQNDCTNPTTLSGSAIRCCCQP
jgi:hypothetical protein